MAARQTRVLRVGILGTARIAPHALIEPAAGSEEVQVMAVASRSLARAHDYATRHRIPIAHGCYQDLIDDANVDAVYIPLPVGLHGRWTLAALAADKDVLVATPFASNADEASLVRDAARRSGRVVMENFTEHFNPLFVRLRELVRTGALGRIREVAVDTRFFVWRRGDIRRQAELSGGAVMNPGYRAVRLARELMAAEPDELSAVRVARGLGGVERSMAAVLHFGPTAVSVTSALRGLPGPEVTVTVRGTEGAARFAIAGSKHGRCRLAVHAPGARQPAWVDRAVPRVRQVDVFADAVLRGGEVPTNVDEALATMSVVDRIYQAAGLPVRQPTRA